MRPFIAAFYRSTTTLSFRATMVNSSTSFKLNTGAEIPAIGLGTWKSEPNQVAEAVSHALKSGYRHIDAAWIYGNEEEVGRGIKDSGVPRSEIFLTTKVWCTYHTKPEECLKQSLERLGTDYVDLLLLHWPMPMNPNGKPENTPKKPDGSLDLVENWSLVDSWKAMEKVYKSGKAKAIGVSNWSIPNLKIILDKAEVVPAANQVELHPYNPQHELVKFCQEKNILLEAYSPLGSTSSPLLAEPAVTKIASSHSVEPATVLISYQVNRGIVTLPKSVTPSRIESNFTVIDLKPEEVTLLNELAEKENKQHRFVRPSWGTDFGFSDWENKSKI